MRMFAAVRPPEHAVEHLEEFLAPRRSPDLRWSPADQLHLTLAFYADVPDRSLDDLEERLGRAAARRTPCEVRVAGGGAFPHVGEGRVLWAGLDTDDAGLVQLTRLAEGARAAASRAGVAVHGQRFRPHLTLARCRPTELTRWVRLLDAYEGPSWTVEEVELVASHLGEGPRNRPRHELVAAFPLSR